MTIYLIFFMLTASLFAIANLIDRKTGYTQSMWLLYALPLVMMALMYGLREGWMTDYGIYEYAFRYKGTDATYEPLFVLLNVVMRALHFDIHGAMTVWALISITGYFFIARQERPLAGIIMILFMMVSISYISNTIRWSTAGGLTCASVALLNERRYVPAALCALCAPLIHASIAPLTAALWLAWWLPFLPKPYYTLPLFVISFLVPPSTIAGLLFKAASGIYESGGIDSDLNMARYVSDESVMESFFDGERSEFGTPMTLLYKVRYAMLFVWFIWEGYGYVRTCATRFNRMLYVSALGYFMLFMPTSGIELMIRIIFFLSLGMPFLAARIFRWQLDTGRYVQFAVGAGLFAVTWYLSLSGVAREFNMHYISL